MFFMVNLPSWSNLVGISNKLLNYTNKEACYERKNCLDQLKALVHNAKIGLIAMN